MVDLINFLQKLFKKKKNYFLKKKDLVAFSLYFDYNTAKIKDLKESQIDGIIKEKILEIKNNLNVYWGFYNFFYDIGICIDLLNDEDKKKILSMNLTYENFGNFATNYYKKFVEKAKKECPPKIYECFEDKAFIIYCEREKSQIKKNNFLSFIKNYFILDRFRKFYENYRNNTIFEKIREHMIDLYPILKAEYGRKNIFVDKFMSLFEGDNDYNNKFILENLNNYNKKIKNDYIKLKQD